LYSTDVTGIIKSRRIIWAGHVSHMGEKRKADTGFVGKARRKETSNKTYA
jgi:hypothetical protein